MEQLQTILIDIEININHKKPLACREDLRLDSISVYIGKRAYADIRDISLWLKRPDGADVRYFYFDLTNFTGYKSDSLYFNVATGEGFDAVKIIEGYNRVSFWPLEPDSNNKFEFLYALKYNDFRNQTFEINGKANLESPIRCMDSVEETGTSTNNSLFRLTWVLIILGAFPFFASLKQLLEKRDES